MPILHNVPFAGIITLGLSTEINYEFGRVAVSNSPPNTLINHVSYMLSNTVFGIPGYLTKHKALQTKHNLVRSFCLLFAGVSYLAILFFKFNKLQ